MKKFIKIIIVATIIFVLFKIGVYTIGRGATEGVMSAIFATLIIEMWLYKTETIEGLSDSIKRTDKLFREARDKAARMTAAIEYIAVGKGSEDAAAKVIREVKEAYKHNG